MKNGRLVVVSNRLPSFRPEAGLKSGTRQSAGGLVSALLPAMEASNKGIWMGWSGRGVSAKQPAQVRVIEHPLMSLIGVDLTERQVEDYYNGFCNRTLWPMFHSFQGRVKLDKEQQECYFQVNEKFGAALLDFLEHGDVVWVHDYHMAPLGRFLRQGGFRGPIGFFLHVPFPPQEMIEILTDPVSFMDAWLDYDLVGFHTERYLDNYLEVAERLKLGTRRGRNLEAGNRRQRVIACPIGIDPSLYDPGRESGGLGSRRKGLRSLIPDIKLVLGVDRLDYTKGIPERIDSFEYFLKRFPQWRRRASLVQICAPSRTRVREYQEQKRTVDAKVGRINGEQAEHDWTPIRYLYRSYDQTDLARFYRDADVALVTPLRDGMNLVAMEYVAAQHLESPGVLVLSRFTGAAEFLPQAVLVNPYLIDSVAEGIDRALSMPLRERKDRHQTMLEFVTNNTSAKWADTFLDALREAHQPQRAGTTAPQPTPVKVLQT
ncbi:MAG TPA: trehalose-6-phosphate synthase [bacterium]|nr:trehalose-6-phosphate synthase [bacterium]